MIISKNLTSSLAQTCAKIETILLSDSGKTKFQPNDDKIRQFFPQGDLFSTIQILKKAKKIAIVTGYLIDTVQSIETDGPLAALILAEFFQKCKKNCTILTDENCFLQLKLAFELVDSPSKVKLLTKDELQQKYDVIILIERIGCSEDGNCYSIRGQRVTVENQLVYQMIQNARHLQIPTIGVGDGGNEIGMGKFTPIITEKFQLKEPYLCIIPTDYFIFCGISNWISWAWMALMEPDYFKEFPLDKEVWYLQKMIEAKMVDGVTYQRTLTVDGMPFSEQLKVRQKILTLI